MSDDGHYDLGNWVDFVRGLCPEEQRSQMQLHQSACRECSAMVSLLDRIWNAARHLTQNTAPEEWSRKAEQIFETGKLGPIRQLPGMAAVLAFDSLSSVSPAHVRSGLQSARHVIYETERCALDLKLESLPERRELSVIGQITDRRDPEAVVPETPVFMFAGEQLIAATSSSQFGEFQFACRQKRKLRISFPFDGWRIDVTLD
jgi:hypothetical protein